MPDPVNNSAELLAPTARSNIEVKARIDDLPTARRTAERIATEHLGVLQQTDTYFHCESGRLKLREISGGPSELIWYQRPDQAGRRTSRFGLIEVEDPVSVKADLSKLLGVWKVVRKTREVFLYHNVRIHLDRVDGLGTYLEFEAVVDPSNDAETGGRRLDFLCDQFSLTDADLIAGSYSDLLET